MTIIYTILGQPIIESDTETYLDNYYLDLYYEQNPIYLYSWR